MDVVQWPPTFFLDASTIVANKIGLYIYKIKISMVLTYHAWISVLTNCLLAPIWQFLKSYWNGEKKMQMHYEYERRQQQSLKFTLFAKTLINIKIFKRILYFIFFFFFFKLNSFEQIQLFFFCSLTLLSQLFFSWMRVYSFTNEKNRDKWSKTIISIGWSFTSELYLFRFHTISAIRMAYK